MGQCILAGVAAERETAERLLDLEAVLWSNHRESPENTTMDLWDEMVAPALTKRDLPFERLAAFAFSCVDFAFQTNKAAVLRISPACLPHLEESLSSAANYIRGIAGRVDFHALGDRVDLCVPGADSPEETYAAFNYTILGVRYLVDAIADGQSPLLFEASRAAYEALTGDALSAQRNSVGVPITERESLAMERMLQGCSDEITRQLTLLASA